MTGRVGRDGGTASRSLRVLAVASILALLIVPAGLLGARPPAPTVLAPHPGSSALGIAETRAALQSLTSRTISPDPWTNLTPGLNLSPSPREGEALVYDPAGPYVLLFGGATGSGSTHETWTFANGHWTDLTSSLSVSPSNRYKSGVAYDAADGYVVLFGGRSNVYFNDTWKWDGGSWSRINTTVAPAAREDCMMTYDAADGYVLMFGGETFDNLLHNDTWSFVGGVWTNLTSSVAPAPPTREAGGMTWDSSAGYVLLFGGSNDPRGDLRDTWSFVGGVWTNLTSGSPAGPAKRETLMLVDDPVDGFVLLFGGLKYPNSLADSWAFSSGTWTSLTTGPAPPARWGGEMVWDPNGGAGFDLLFAGVNSPMANAGYFNDTWTFKVPLASSLVSDHPALDLGSTVNFSLTAQGGYPGYRYGWTGLPAGCSVGNVTAIACTPTAVGNFTIAAWTRDTQEENVTSNSVALEVVPRLAVTGSVLPVSGSAPLVVQYTTDLLGGLPPVTLNWTFGDGAGSANLSGEHSYSAAGTYQPSLVATDAAGFVATAPALPLVTVHAGLVVTASAAPSNALVGQSVTLSATVTGGWAPYEYLWTFGVGGSTSSLANPNTTYSTAGQYNVTLTVTDALGASANSTVPVTVADRPPLVATASANVTSGTAPLAVAFSGSASGGLAPYTYSWSFGDGSAAAAGASADHTYPLAGNFTVLLTAQDAAGAMDQSTLTITVQAVVPVVPPALNASFASSVGTPYCAGGAPVAQLTLSATASGGTAPYSYLWTVAASTYSDARVILVVPAAGRTSVDLSVSDSSGHLVRLAGNATIPALSCASTAGAGSSGINLLLLVVIVLIAAVIAVEAVVLLRKKP